MFDIAFSELVVVALVALIVIGPERLPKVARTAGHLWGRVQRYVHNVKSDIANDIAFEDARKFHGEINAEVAAIGHSVKETELTVQQQLLQAQYKTPSASVEQPVSTSALPPASGSTDARS